MFRPNDADLTTDPRGRPIPVRMPALSMIAAGLFFLGGCASSPDPGPATDASWSEDSWSQLALPRPTPMEGAPRIAVADAVAAAGGWMLGEADASLALTELVVAGLLERRDVHFVERRRFGPAAERQLAGEPAPPGQPPVGTSPGAEWLMIPTWVAVPGSSAALDVRLVHVETGASRGGWRVEAPANSDPAAVARLAVRTLLTGLDELGLSVGDGQDGDPEWTPSSIPAEAIALFVAGIRSEDEWNWAAARGSFERANAAAGGAFGEAEVALRRAARLRAGGSLGES